MPTSANFPRTADGCVAYVNGTQFRGTHRLVEAARQARARREGFVWVCLENPGQEQLSGIADLFDLHPLAVEEALHAHQRPKLECFGDTLFTVIKTVQYTPHERSTTAHQVSTGEVMIFSGLDFTVTVEHGSHATLNSVRAALKAAPERLNRGPSTVLHAIVDHAVDGYLTAVEAVRNDIEQTEYEVFSRERQSPVEPVRIYQLKRGLLGLRRAVTPLEGPLSTLSLQPLTAIHPQMQNYFRDVTDHLLQVGEQVEAFGNLIDSILDADLAQVAVAQNEDMRRISAWLTLIAIPTMACGIYGMNFDYMPELRWAYGYPALLTAIVVLCLAVHRAFRRSGWL
ncbi:magnesium and cobalt transport protein CorA [Streptomyces syringium]|uniref:magnesium and cobalt transport protein CorA n=1 Tax=Streptomyces syringium TaxID=76729 RepID=UPI003D8AE947